MECSCEVPADVSFYSAFQKQKHPKARKVYKCYECGREIEKGEKYQKIVDFCEHKFSQYITCKDCLSVKEKFFTDGYYFGMVWEELEAHIRENLIRNFPWSCLTDLTKPARDKICEFIEELWEEWED
jgi:hypothetical protein